MRRFLVLAASSVLLVAAPGAVRAEDAPKTYPLVLRTRWKAGDTVTMKGEELKISAIVKVVDGKEVADENLPPKEERKTAYEAVVQCVEADTEGRLVKALLHLTKFAARDGDQADTSAEGATFRVQGLGEKRTLTLVGTSGAPSEKAKAWLDETFGKGSKTDALLDLLTPKVAQPVGGTWDVPGAEIVKVIATSELPVEGLDATATKAELKLEAVEDGKAEVHCAMVVALRGLPAGGTYLPWKDGGKGTTVVRYVRALAADGAASVTESEDSFDGVAEVPEQGFEIHMAIKQTQTIHVTKGGTIPEAK